MPANFTGNDIALAQFACALAIAWHKQQPTCGFQKKEIAKYQALSKKLSETLDWAYPEGVQDLQGGEDDVLIPNDDRYGLPVF